MIEFEKGKYNMKVVVEFIRGISDGGAETLVKDYASTNCGVISAI